ncbi:MULTISPECIES: ABC transporter ATP-binding protein [unclassified Pseudoalteromonas]|uniref:ABC transporter ATP-binding protein n=1 Tax=unclassified Pseudoalteromonas TaxID=194690 RepID=UPI002096DC94|nr:ABC transporter ATP-binding protein [Pseudoalteromonas sp. XMcav2-N]MCO7190417.1 ABC transporter ATP-binding protein [Pseudoalteromonas sp. XMcav2-N]
MIQLDEVTFKRPDGIGYRHVLDGLSWSVAAGEQVALTGESGSGKTTLLNILAGLLTPDAGSVLINEQKISHYNTTELALYRRTIGIIFQHYQLLSPLTVADNMAFQARLNGRSVSHGDIMAMAERLGMAAKLDAYPAQLSGGEQQRVGIARALLNQPRMLLADEPTGNLDSVRSQEVLELLMALCKEQYVNLIMVTHSRALAAQLPRLVELRDGRIHE